MTSVLAVFTVQLQPIGAHPGGNVSQAFRHTIEQQSLTADTNHRPGYHLRIDVGSGHGDQSAVSSPPCIAGKESLQGPTLEVRRKARVSAPTWSIRIGRAYLVLTLCGLALRSTRMTRPRVQRTSP